MATVVSVRLSGAGLPLVVLSNSTAFALHLGMKTWMRVADSNFSFSSYMSIFSRSAASAGAAPHVPLQQLRKIGLGSNIPNLPHRQLRASEGMPEGFVTSLPDIIIWSFTLVADVVIKLTASATGLLQVT